MSDTGSFVTRLPQVRSVRRRENKRGTTENKSARWSYSPGGTLICRYGPAGRLLTRHRRRCGLRANAAATHDHARGHIEVLAQITLPNTRKGMRSRIDATWLKKKGRLVAGPSLLSVCC